MPTAEPGGFLLSLLTESFAVRAFLGSLAAAGLAAAAVRTRVIRSTRARRLLVLTPVLVAAVAGVASIRDAEAYLPQLWVGTTTSGAAATVLDLLGELRAVSTDGAADLLVIGYGLAVAVLLLRRALGLLAIRRLLLTRAYPPTGHGYLVPTVHRLAEGMGVTTPRVVLVPRCPGGAFTVGVRHPVLAVDPQLLDRLDDHELEGLLAHELAHVRRRDALTAWLVGAFRDVTFFLPPVHLACRWLRHEQEESADDVASRQTGRPVALASSILKVWDCSRDRRSLRLACAAVPARRLGLAGGGVADGRLSSTARLITARVERLINAPPAITRWRSLGETALVGVVLTAAAAVALHLPAWLATDLNAYSLSIGYLAGSAPQPVESAAFTTFRALAPTAAPDTGPESMSVLGLGGVTSRSDCPCVESQAQLRSRQGAGSAQRAHSLQWRAAGVDPWEFNNLRERTAVQARPLWTLNHDSGPQMGLFLLGHPTS